MTHAPNTYDAQLKQTVADEYGIDPETVRLIDFDFARLAESCVQVRIIVEGVSQFRKTASWGVLGVAEKDMRREDLTRGTVACWPMEQVRRLESLEQQLRTTLPAKYSHDIDGFQPYRVFQKGTGSQAQPDRSPFWTWRAEHDAKLVEWDAAVAAVLDQYDTARTRFEGRITRMAAEGYIALAARCAEVGDTPPDPVKTIEADIKRAMDRFPSRDHLRASLRVAVLYRKIRNPIAVAELLEQLTRDEVTRDAIEQEVLNSTVIGLLDLGAPVVQVLNEAVAELWRDAGEVLSLIRDGRRFQHTTAERVRGWKPRYLLMAGGRDAAVEAALDACAVALPADAKKGADLGPLVDAVTELRQATRGAADAMVRIRPEVWGALVELAATLGEGEVHVHD